MSLTLAQLESLKDGYNGDLLTQESGEEFERAIDRWAVNSIARPLVVARPRSALEIQNLVRWCAKQEPLVKPAIKCGGHSGRPSPHLHNGLLIDLNAHMHGVRVEKDAEGRPMVAVQGGALWQDVNETAIEHDLAVVGGTVSHTGVGGLTLGGGHGWQTGQYGLVVDNLLSCSMILSSGEEFADVSKQSHPELFWAMRGAGAEFGIVTEFRFLAHAQRRKVFMGYVTWKMHADDEVLGAMETLVNTIPDHAACFVGYDITKDDDNVPQACILVSFYYNGDEADARALWAPLLTIPGKVRDTTRMDNFEQLAFDSNDLFRHGLRQSEAAATMHKVDRKMFAAAKAMTNKFVTMSGYEHFWANVEFIPFRKQNQVPASETAYSRRSDDLYDLYYGFTWSSVDTDPAIESNLQALSDSFAAVSPGYRKQPYLNRIHATTTAPMTTTDAAQASQSTDPAVKKIREVMAKYDPLRMFTRHEVLLA